MAYLLFIILGITTCSVGKVSWWVFLLILLATMKIKIGTSVRVKRPVLR